MGTGVTVAATPLFADTIPYGERYAGPQYPNNQVGARRRTTTPLGACVGEAMHPDKGDARRVHHVTRCPEPCSQTKSVYEVLRQVGNVVAVHLVHIPGTDKYLYMERPSGYHPIRSIWQVAGTFDLVTRLWTPVNTPDGLFCAGHTFTSDGRIVIVGGHREVRRRAPLRACAPRAGREPHRSCGSPRLFPLTLQNAGFASGLSSVRLYDWRNDSKTIIKVTELGWKRW